MRRRHLVVRIRNRISYAIDLTVGAAAAIIRAVWPTPRKEKTK